MKKILFLLAATFLISSCSGIKRLQKDPMITTNPTTINLTADGENPLVDVSFQINVPKKYVPKRGQLIYQPQFLTNEYNSDLTPVIINGKKIAKKEKKMLKNGIQLQYPNAIRIEGDRKPVSIDYDVQAPFFAWMPESELVGWTLLSTGKKKKEAVVINRQIIAEGVAAPMAGPGPVRTKQVTKESKAEQEQVEKIYFVINSAKYDKNLSSNAQNEADLKNLIAKINNTSNISLVKINVIGAASPDGTAEINSKLAASRAETVKAMLVSDLGISPEKIEVSSMGADWSGFKILIGNSSLSNKGEIMKIADSNFSDWKKSEELRKLNNYNAIKTNILPELRNVTCEVKYVVTTTTTELVPL